MTGLLAYLKVVCANVVVGVVYANQHPVVHEALSRNVPKYQPVTYTDLHEKFAHHERQRRGLGVNGAEPLLFELELFGKSLEIEVMKTGITAYGESVVYNKGGKNIIDVRDLPVVEGHVTGDTDSYVKGRIFNGVFEGYIHTADETYHLEKASKFLKNPDFHAVAYQWSDVDYQLSDGSHVCGKSAHSMLKNMHTQLETGSRINKMSRTRRASAVTPTANTCMVKLVADHLFFAYQGGSAQAIAAMETALGSANLIYATTPFYEDTTGVSVKLAPDGFIVYENADNPVASSNNLVNETLLDFSAINWDDSCLAHLFTYQDYGGGTLGLAWVGDASSNGQAQAGGICEQQVNTRNGLRSLNSGLTTSLNFGRPVPEVVVFLTVAHEIGHNFGAEHDPDGTCAPGGSQGNYIMYAQAGDGSLPNNRAFSTCSIASMVEVMDEKATCFVPYPEARCGNGIVENEEECDCGADPCPEGSCCTNECELVGDCDPRHDECCSLECAYSNASTVCRTAGECLNEALCTGTSAKCPTSEPKPELEKCGNDAFLCRADGVCAASEDYTVCNLYESDYCEIAGLECVVSCKFNGICNSTVAAAAANEEIVPAFYPGGRNCYNSVAKYNGYCDGKGECVKFTGTDSLDAVANFFSSGNIYTISHYIQDNWYWFLSGAIALAFATLLLWWQTKREYPKLLALEASQKRSRKVKNASTNSTSQFRDEGERDEIKRLRELYAKENAKK
eukprot:CFRG7004T1